MRSLDATPPPSEELEAAWRDLENRKAELESDRTLAELAVRVIAGLGNQTKHRDVLHRLAQAWPRDRALILGAGGLLLEQAQRRGMDEPVTREDTPARWAASAFQSALEALRPAETKDPEVAGRLFVGLANALRLCGPGEDAASQEAFRRALELDESRGSWWYDVGLLHKWRGRFAEGLVANQHALALGAARRPTLFNLAICATALGRGQVARDAWRDLGMPAESDPRSGMPLLDGLPPMLVRVLSRPSPVDGTTGFARGVGFEVVWVAPLSPTHGVVQSPTFRDAPIDYGDLVLWDGAPVAEQVAASGPIPIFPLLEILRRGDEHRWSFVALQRAPRALAVLEGMLPDGARLFLQQEHIHHPCPQCEAGVPHQHDAGSVAATVTATESATVAESGSVPVFSRGKVILPATADLPAFRRAWEAAVATNALTVSLPQLYEELGETKRAGQAHQAWRGIERKALRQKAPT